MKARLESLEAFREEVQERLGDLERRIPVIEEHSRTALESSSEAEGAATSNKATLEAYRLEFKDKVGFATVDIKDRVNRSSLF